MALGASAFAAAAPAGASGAVHMQALLNADGSGRLFVNDSGGGWSWEACSENLASCMPFPGGQELSTVGAAPETVFRVSGQGGTGLSPLWHGDLVSLGPPSVAGKLRANELVRPVPGQWSGGWEGEGDEDELQLAACKRPDGTGCTTLTNSHYVGGCKGEAAVLDPAFAGRYLRVADARIGAGPHYVPAYAVSSPYGPGAWAASATISVAVVGRIAHAKHRRTVKCGPPSVFGASISAKGEAAVRCMIRCRAVLLAKRGPKRLYLRRRVRATPWAARLRFPPKALNSFGPGRARLVVKINGKRAAARTLRLRPRNGSR